MDEDGDFNDAPELAADETDVHYGRQCQRVTGFDICEKAFNFHKCIEYKKDEN